MFRESVGLLPTGQWTTMSFPRLSFILPHVFPFVSFISEFGRTAATDRFLYGPVRAMEFLNSLLRTYHRLDCMNECPGGECYEDGKQYTISHEAAARLFVITLA
ncbi:MAG TPA: hypothetical protein VFX07_12630 [Candidatus Udaeobacter sp.]|nr:hypothetical protein [Candidatus Udaeobacter sp.]